jgi:hypothetical protein
MDRSKLRPILLGAFAALFCLTTLVLLSERASLTKKNRDLLEKAKTLENAIDQARISADQRADEALTALQRDNAALQAQIKENADRLASIHEEKSYLEEMLINKTKQIELLQKNGSAAPAAAAVPATYDRDEEMKRLIEQNRILQEKLDRLYKTTSAKINEINLAKIALEETVSTAKKKIEDEWNTVDLGKVSAAPEAPKKAARSQGKVLAINPDHGFVVVDLGRADGLPSGAMLQVVHGDQAIATLSVLEIRDVMAACNIKDVADGQKIEINDPVSVLR